MTAGEQLSKMLVLAANRHDGQFDKGGKPYILHPLKERAAKMKTIEFDLTNTPPAVDALADARREAEATLAKIALRERHIKWACYGIALLAFGVLFAMWRSGYLTGAQFAVGGAISIAFASAGAFAIAIAIAGAYTLAIAFAFAGAGAAAVVFTMAGAIAGAITGVYLYRRFIDFPRADSNRTIEMATELDPKTMPEQCIQFVEWMDSDATVKNYQKQLAVMGRKPVMGEYKAAKAWIDASGARVDEADTIERAKRACERMSVAG